MPESAYRIFGLPLDDLGKSVGRAWFRDRLDRRITVEDPAYPHGE